MSSRENTGERRSQIFWAGGTVSSENGDTVAFHQIDLQRNVKSVVNSSFIKVKKA